MPERAEPSVPAAGRPAPGRRRLVELVALFGVVPGLLALAPRWVVSLGILSSGVIAAVALLLDRSFPGRALVSFHGVGPGLRAVLLRALAIGVGLLAFTALTAPRALGGFPRHRPVVWAAVMVLYPLSAYAQELVFRPFFFHRYGGLFSTPRRRVLASGLVFGWAHIVVNNVLAMALASIAGLLFASTYERSRSTILVSVEHALYGDLAFTIGLGSVFYSTARWLG